MNNFHVYEEIGRGKHSTVYKGRKKKTIEYYAIKSLDKTQRSKVLQEVRMLHSLNHQNILKFFSWYETSAHLWLILEYCVGGDLKSLVESDGRLPESSVHDLAHNLVEALGYLHSKGIVYCDLKPSNILMNEYGRMKLCDFGLARRLSDIEKNSLASLPQSMRGTPYYMAPELFHEGGSHSYASDFWALGCVLYQCYTGKLPFEHRELTQLVKSIVSDPIPPLPDSTSRSFQNLIDSLLIKDPNERLQWPDICSHSFWRTQIDVTAPVPPRPASVSVLQTSNRKDENNKKEENSTKVSRLRTPPRNNNGNKKDENSSKGFATPNRNVQSGRKGGITKPPSGTKGGGVNILRFSRAAKLNLQREKDKGNYRRQTPLETGENESEVKLENNDMELDFTENPEEDASDDPDAPDSSSSNNNNNNDNNNNNNNSENTPGEKIQTQTHTQNSNGEQTEESQEIDMVIEENSNNNNNTQNSASSELDITAATPPTVNARKAKPVCTPVNPDSGLGSDLTQVFWHGSDLLVKPVMPGRKADKTLDSVSALTFDSVPACDYVKLPAEQLSALNTQIIHSLSGTSQVSEKQNVIKYLELLSGNSDAANIITSGPLMLLLVKMLRLSKVSALRVQIAYLIGLLIRHSTIIEAELANSGIIGALTNGLRDKQDKLRRYCMAALGELLFYISTQSENNNGKEGSNAFDSPSKDNRSTPTWPVTSSVIGLVSSILRRGEDDLTQLYALRTIDNISSQGSDWTSRFACPDVISNLCYIYRSSGKLENTRLIAGSCLVRLSHFSPSCVQLIFEKLPFRDLASTLIKGNPREQQIALNLLNSALINIQLITNLSRQMISLTEEKQLVPGVISLIEQGSEVLRGKALLFTALLCKGSKRWLPHFLCNVKLLSAVDRLGREKSEFVYQCTESFVQLVAGTVPGMLDTIFGDIQQLIGSRRNGLVNLVTARGANPKSTIHLFPVVLHLLGSVTFKHRVVTSHVMVQLANLTKLFETSFPGRDDIQISLLRILESITEEPTFILNNHKIFTSRIIPSLSVLYKGNKDEDARLLCLKILIDAMLVICTDTSAPAEDQQTREDLKTVSHSYFLPLYPIMVQEEDPIPVYAQKLLVSLIECDYVKVSDILHLKTVSQCFEFLLGDLSNANVSNIKLCQALASDPEMDAKTLSDLRVVRKIGNLLELVVTKEMDEFLEPTLGLCRAFIVCGIGRSKAEAISKKPYLLGDTAFDMGMLSVQSPCCIEDLGDFGCNLGIFIDLARSSELQIVNLASDCVVLLARAAVREATVGLLTNLLKLPGLIQYLHRDELKLPLLRVMHALAFACRQYIDHAMILSIQVQALVQVGDLVLGLKGSDIYGVATAADYLSAELERLPHCA